MPPPSLQLPFLCEQGPETLDLDGVGTGPHHGRTSEPGACSSTWSLY